MKHVRAELAARHKRDSNTPPPPGEEMGDLQPAERKSEDEEEMRRRGGEEVWSEHDGLALDRNMRFGCQQVWSCWAAFEMKSRHLRVWADTQNTPREVRQQSLIAAVSSSTDSLQFDYCIWSLQYIVFTASIPKNIFIFSKDLRVIFLFSWSWSLHPYIIILDKHVIHEPNTVCMGEYSATTNKWTHDSQFWLWTMKVLLHWTTEAASSHGEIVE